MSLPGCLLQYIHGTVSFCILSSLLVYQLEMRTWKIFIFFHWFPLWVVWNWPMPGVLWYKKVWCSLTPTIGFQFFNEFCSAGWFSSLKTSIIKFYYRSSFPLSLFDQMISPCSIFKSISTFNSQINLHVQFPSNFVLHCRRWPPPLDNKTIVVTLETQMCIHVT